MNPLIRADNLHYTYNLDTEAPITALAGVSLKVWPGEYLAIVGRNGSGKSTLARCLNSLALPTAGEVQVNGLDTRDPRAWREIRSTVGMVFQNPDNQFVSTVVDDEVAFGPENLGLPRDDLRQRVDWALGVTGLADARNANPRILSAGDKARLAIAAILAMRPNAWRWTNPPPTSTPSLAATSWRCSPACTSRG
jgi:energy-coupling factor transporter ATP-binding protein EcfA2